MTRQTATLGALLVAGSALLGALAHFAIFSLSFFASPWAWAAVAARVILAFCAGRLWRRYGSGSLRLLGLIFVALDCGVFLMLLWAAFNYSETGSAGLSIVYWGSPARQPAARAAHQ